MVSPERPLAHLTVAGLFAGVGGLEVGLGSSGIHAVTLVESWEPARLVLRNRFPDADLLGDVAEVRTLPPVDVLTAGFPCTDLSQAGRMQGIDGAASGLVRHVFELLPKASPTWLVIENVRNMLALDGGRAMRYLVDELEAQGYRWAYRLVDSRSFGVPQRRQRVLLVASREADPRTVLFADESGVPDEASLNDDAFGFYWTEGLTGLGWAQDAVPTLKGGSTVGIPSPPAIWIRDAPLGRRIVTPTIEDAEALQGFDRGWTEPASSDGKRNGPRWKLAGNAVTVGASAWLGRRLTEPGKEMALSARAQEAGGRWPTAAWGERGQVYAVEASMWPERRPYQHLLDVVSPETARPLSIKATTGFLSRTERSRLRFNSDFLLALKEHATVRMTLEP